MKDPWHIGPRMRYWRKQRGMTIAVLADLLGRAASWVQMAETGHRVPYRLDDLIRIATALRVDLGSFLCDPVPGVPDDDQRDVLMALRDAFTDPEPRSALAGLADRLAEVESGEDLMLVVLPGGRWQLVNRRDAIKMGATLGISLAAPAHGLEPEQAGALAASLETQEVGHDGAAAIRAIVNAYRHLDDEIGSAVLAPLVQHNLRIVRGLKAKSDKVRPSLGIAAAEFHQLAGWLSFDAGDFASARKYYGAALRIADQVNETHVAARVLTDISYLETTARNPLEGIRAAASGLERASRTSSRTLQAAAAIFQARAHAEAGDRDNARAAIGLAQDRLRAANREDDPSFMYYFGWAVLDAHAGLSYVALGEPQPASDACGRAVEEIDPTFVRDKARYLIYHASALALDNEIPEACRMASEAAGLLEHTSSARTTRLLKELHAVRLRPVWHLPEVRELGDRLYAL